MDKTTLFGDIVIHRSDAAEVKRQYDKVSSATNLATLLETMPHCVMILNHFRQIVWTNQTLLRWINKTSPTEFLGLRPGEVFNCVNAVAAEHGCGAARQCQVCGALLAILTSLKDGGAEEECMLLTTTNDALNLRFKAGIIDLDGERFDVVSIVDISPEKNKRILERLFFHDIMNLAGSIQGLVELLPELTHENSSHLSEVLPTIIHGTGDLIELVKSQKDLLSAESNELSVYSKSIHARQLVASVKQLFERHESYREKPIEIQSAQEDIVFQSDERILKRVITNAIKNALEATATGESIDLRFSIVSGRVLFEIHNSSYIPEEVQGQMFRKTFSTKSRDRGIGTYSIKLFTEKYLHGKVWFTSEKEKGTTFYIEIPCCPDNT